jgi:hypothetical protein
MTDWGFGVKPHLWLIHFIGVIAPRRLAAGMGSRVAMARTSFTLALLGIAGTIALAVIGVYGVLAYVIGQRRREVSIRVALGAQPHQVTSLFLRRVILLARVGGIVGVAAAMGLSRWVSSLLFGVTAFDPATYVASALIVSAGRIGPHVKSSSAQFTPRTIGRRRLYKFSERPKARRLNRSICSAPLGKVRFPMDLGAKSCQRREKKQSAAEQLRLYLGPELVKTA